MLIFILPKPNINIYKYINLEIINEKPQPYVSHSLSICLNETKKQIQLFESKWDKYKKYTNEYEFIHTNIPNRKTSVSKYKPISRSYFKMIELIHRFELNTNTCTPIKTFHLAEGPGGFIEACVNVRKNKFREISKEDKYYGMTLINDKENNHVVPGWKRGEYFLKQNSNIFIETGEDKTGDILSLPNFLHINERYGSSMDLITADGGFDFSLDFNNQELAVSKLLYGQIICALCMQKKGGSFVLKIFDCFMQCTVDMLLLLSSMYDEVYITKPHTSRSANSEKYIVCKGFIGCSLYFFPYLYYSFKFMTEMTNDSYMKRILRDYEIPYYFSTKIEKINGLFGQMQLENIQTTIELINQSEKNQTNYSNYCNNITENIDVLIHDNVKKCIQWCLKHSL